MTGAEISPTKDAHTLTFCECARAQRIKICVLKTTFGALGPQFGQPYSDTLMTTILLTSCEEMKHTYLGAAMLGTLKVSVKPHFALRRVYFAPNTK